MRDIVNLRNASAFRFVSFNSGKDGQHKADGFQLPLEDLTSSKDAYAIFNVDLTRKRVTKSGQTGRQPLSGRQFRVLKKSHIRQS